MESARVLVSTVTSLALEHSCWQASSARLHNPTSSISFTIDSLLELIRVTHTSLLLLLLMASTESKTEGRKEEEEEEKEKEGGKAIV